VSAQLWPERQIVQGREPRRASLPLAGQGTKSRHDAFIIMAKRNRALIRI